MLFPACRTAFCPFASIRLRLVKRFEFEPVTNFLSFVSPVLTPLQSTVLVHGGALGAAGGTSATPEVWLLEELRNLRAGGEGGGKGEDAHKCLRHKLGLPQSCDDF